MNDKVIGKECTGYGNLGNRNSGDKNSGDWNSGGKNSGNRNSGSQNSGYWNSGHRNSGVFNSGDGNSGDWNSGAENSGKWNSGNGNLGHNNSGHNNLGHQNSGDWNSGVGNSGVFCTEEPKIKIFDVQSDMTLFEWRSTKASQILRQNFKQNIWICSEDMTEEEKKQHLSHKTTGGYLKTFSYKEAWGNLWNNLSDKEKEVIKNIPNFNEEKFEEITGIRV